MRAVSRWTPGVGGDARYTLPADGTLDPIWPAPNGWYGRLVRHGLWQCRLVDLLRAWAGRVLRARADASRLRRHGVHLLSDRRDLRRGDRHVSRGGRLRELCPSRLQRILVLLRGLGADAQLHDHRRDFGVLRAALSRWTVLAGAPARPGGRVVRLRRRGRPFVDQRRRREG